MKLEELPSIYNVKKVDPVPMQAPIVNQTRAPAAPSKPNYSAKKSKPKYAPKNTPRAPSGPQNTAKGSGVPTTPNTSTVNIPKTPVTPMNAPLNSQSSTKTPVHQNTSPVVSTTPVNNYKPNNLLPTPGKLQPADNVPPVAPNIPPPSRGSIGATSVPPGPNLQQQKITSYHPVPKPNNMPPNATLPPPIIPKPPIISNPPVPQSIPKPPVQVPYKGASTSLPNRPPPQSSTSNVGTAQMGSFSRMSNAGNRSFMNNTSVSFSPTPQAPATSFNRNISSGFQNVGMQRIAQPVTQISVENFDMNDDLTQQTLADLDEKLMFDQYNQDF